MIKKIISTFLIFSMTSTFCLAASVASNGGNDIIEDELLKSPNMMSIIPVYAKENNTIQDEIFKTFEKQGDVLNIWIGKTKNKEQESENISDELVNDKFIKKHLKNNKNNQLANIEDELLEKCKIRKIRKISHKSNYDFTKKQIAVNVKIIENFVKKKQNIDEGDVLSFVSTNDVTIKNKLFPKGTIIEGRIETISASDKMGTPETIVLDNFYIKDFPDILLHGHLSKTGANRAIWVYPLYQAGNIFLYVAGFVFVPIHGGHAKILTKDNFTIYYEEKI